MSLQDPASALNCLRAELMGLSGCSCSRFCTRPRSKVADARQRQDPQPRLLPSKGPRSKTHNSSSSSSSSSSNHSHQRGAPKTNKP